MLILRSIDEAMGLLTIIKKQKIKDKEIRVLTLGLDNAGKTTIIKQILGEDTKKVSPTMGFQINTIQYKDYNLNMWDIGGQTTIRNFWSNYFDRSNIIIWVIDSLSLERLDESYQELREKIILQDQLVGTYLVVLINKVDMLDPQQHQSVKDQVIKVLNLDRELNQDRYIIQLVSGYTGEGLSPVLDWMIERDI